MSDSPVERAILVDLLIYGDDKAENIGNRTGFHRNSVSNRLKSLLEDGKVAKKGEAVYRLTDDGREAGLGLVRGGYVPYQDDD